MALDRELNRKVAFKEILDKAADYPAIRGRFVAEAEITGKLEHPGIVPVYSLGRDATGRPYYAMRFVEGDNLHKAIERFHNPPAPLEPGERHRQLLGLLRRFLDVCNAVAFAHRKGVLHRDIKPGNVLLGEYGETLVVDWGLAKAMGQPGPEAPPDDEPVRLSGEDDDSYNTLPGQAMGTPGFMSPEQAQGRLDLLGPPSDVYSLGATLYQLLTGRRPFDPDRIAAKLIQRTLEGDILPPREVKPDVPPPLEAICLKAMALKASDRYPTPRALAQDIESWLADEPVSAWPEPWSVRARRWAKRHRTLVTSSAAALVVAVVGLSLGLFLLDAARRRESNLNDDLRTANSSLAKALKDVEAANETANRRLDQTMEAIRDYYTGISEDVLLGREEFRELREKLLAKPMAFYEAITRELEFSPADDMRSKSLLASGRFALGHILEIMGRHKESQEQSRAAIAAYEELVAAQPDVREYPLMLARSYSCLERSLRDTGDHPDAFAAVLKARQSMVTAIPSLRENLDGLGNSNPGDTSSPEMDSHARAVETLRKVVERLGERVASNPGAHSIQHMLVEAYCSLGNRLRDQEDYTGAFEAYRKAVEQAEALVTAYPGVPRYRDGLAASYFTLGLLQQEQDQHEEAVGSFRKAIEHRRIALKAAPGVAQIRQRLKNDYQILIQSLRALKRDDEAEAAEAELRAIEGESR